MKKFNKLVKNLTKKLLQESPFYVGEKPLYINLDDLQVNNNVLASITQDNPNKIDKFEIYDVYCSVDKQTRYDTFYFINNGIIEALVSVDDEDGIGYTKTIAKRNIPENKTLARDIFLNYFPIVYNSIVSDEYMNHLGKNFWKKLLDSALAKNYSAKVLISNTGEERNYNPEEFESYWNSKSEPIIRRPSPTRMLFKIYFK
jgi:hypothetical protein